MRPQAKKELAIQLASAPERQYWLDKPVWLIQDAKFPIQAKITSVSLRRSLDQGYQWYYKLDSVDKNRWYVESQLFDLFDDLFQYLNSPDE